MKTSTKIVIVVAVVVVVGVVAYYFYNKKKTAKSLAMKTDSAGTLEKIADQ